MSIKGTKKQTKKKWKEFYTAKTSMDLNFLKFHLQKTKIKKKVDSPYALLGKICDYLDLGANKPQPRLKLSHSREYLREKGKIKGTILALEKKKKEPEDTGSKTTAG